MTARVAPHPEDVQEALVTIQALRTYRLGTNLHYADPSTAASLCGRPLSQMVPAIHPHSAATCRQCQKSRSGLNRRAAQ